MHKKTTLSALGFLLTGFIVAYFIFGYETESPSLSKNVSRVTADGRPTIANPFSVREENSNSDTRIEYLENELLTVKQQLQQIEESIQQLADASGSGLVTSRPVISNRNRFVSALSKRLYSLDNLIKGGIDPLLAEDIVRRKNSIELKRLALQDRATREGYLNTQQYYDELEAINRDDVSLREELGDDRYDEYLYNSKQNNRIRISSVMLGSAAEQAGIQSGDVVLSYDNTRMFNWQELKDATSEGQLGEYVSISIYRDGQIYSFSVPRGALGIELGATRLLP